MKQQKSIRKLVVLLFVGLFTVTAMWSHPEANASDVAWRATGGETRAGGDKSLNRHSQALAATLLSDSQDYVPLAPLDVPENITTNRAFDVALGGGYVFLTNLVGEFCSPPGRVQSVNLTTRIQSILDTSCDISPANVVADDTYVYYAEWTSDTIQRIPVGGGTPSTVASATGLIYHRALALDDTHVYFGDNLGIKRVPKAGGAVETLATTEWSEKLAVDDSFLYWTEDDPLGEEAIRRIPQAGGSVQTILSGANVDAPGAIVVDDTYVYWTERSNSRVARVAKGGGTPSTLVAAQGSYVGGAIAVDDTHVYWTDTTGSSDGRVRRVPKAGGAIDDLALGLLGPGAVNLSASHVYWSDYGGVWRLPLGAGGVAVDLTIDALEITQAVQNLANDIPLVEDKTTYVRVYPAVDIADTPGVRAVLHGSRGGVSLSGSPLYPVEPTVYVRTTGSNRSLLSNSFNFWIPPDWRSGTVTFRAEINPGDVIPETDADNNGFSLTRTFNHKDPLCVDMVRVRTAPTTASIYDSGFWDIVEWLEAAYPVPNVRIYRGGTIEELQVCWAGPFPYPCGGPYEIPDDADKVLVHLWTYNLFTDDPSECNDQAYYYGMVHPSETEWYGKGYLPGDEALGVMNVDPNALGASWPDWFLPAGGSILAHELGHNFGRRHVDCPEGGPAGTDGGYPYGCDIGPDDPSAYYGFDVLDVAVIPPTTAGDLMSYSHWIPKPHWVSDYTYRALYNQLPSRALAASSALAQRVVQSDEVLAVTGLVTPTENTASLNATYRLTQGTVSANKLGRLAARIQTSAAASYTLRLVAANDTILAEQAFDLPDSGDPVGDARSFNMLIPYDLDTAAIVLVQDNTELARRTVSASPPTVEVTSPNGGENFTDTMTITWEASDPDDDTLLFTVQYSPDDGTTWQTLVASYYTQTLTLNDLAIPGSDAALIQVIATDGVNTTIDASDASFQVAEHPPDVHISRPTDRAIFYTGVQVILTGSAFDTEDGMLEGAALQWSVDGAPQGTGSELALSDLEPGKHLITLEATDSGNNTATDNVDILVGDERVYLPIILR